MATQVQILHREYGGAYKLAFNWSTKKVGVANHVGIYVLSKFKTASDFPKGYSGRPLEKGDRIQLTFTSGVMAGRVVTFELVGDSTIMEV